MDRLGNESPPSLDPAWNYKDKGKKEAICPICQVNNKERESRERRRKGLPSSWSRFWDGGGAQVEESVDKDGNGMKGKSQLDPFRLHWTTTRTAIIKKARKQRDENE